MGQNQPAVRKRIAILPTVLLVVLLSFLIMPFAVNAAESKFPTKPIQVVVPYQPGGPTDITSRILTKKVTALLGQPVVVVNKPGGATAIGTQSVLAAPADGYTVLAAELSLITLPLITKNVGFTLQDFIAFNLATSAPLTLIVKKDAPWRNLDELVADAKKNPGKISYSTAGPGSISRFTGELFQKATGAQITQVPMNGAAPAVTAVLGGHVSMSFMGLQVIQSHLQAGTLRGLAVMYDKRHKDFPNIPTVAEQGYKGMHSAVYVPFLVSAKTPADVVKRLSDVFHAAMQDKEVIEMCEQAGFVVENLAHEQAQKYVTEDQKRWAEVAKAANIVPK